MTKRLIDIDDSLLAEAKDILGTATMKDAIAHALTTVVEIHHSREQLKALASEAGSELRDDEVMSQAWR